MLALSSLCLSVHSTCIFSTIVNNVDTRVTNVNKKYIYNVEVAKKSPNDIVNAVKKNQFPFFQKI